MKTDRPPLLFVKRNDDNTFTDWVSTDNWSLRFWVLCYAPANLKLSEGYAFLVLLYRLPD